MRKAIFALILLLAPLGSSGCSKSYLVQKVRPRRVYAKFFSSALTSEELSQATQQQLRLLFLDETFAEQPEKVIGELELQASQSAEFHLRVAVVELSLFYARQLEKENKNTALAYYVLAAAHAYDFLHEDQNIGLAAKVDPYGPFMTRIYNAAVDRVIELWQESGSAWSEVLNLQTPNTLYVVSTELERSDVFPPESFDKYQGSSSIEVEGLRNEYRKFGVGAALVGIKKNELKSDTYLPYRTRPAIYSPISAILSFAPKNSLTRKAERKVSLRFYDLLRSEELVDGETSLPLEGDFSTPFAMLLAAAHPDRGAFRAALASDENLDLIEMFMIDRYDPNKIPVVMVHGLFSSPETYIEMFNDLRGVEVIRRNYQFWFFRYPTGLPIMYSSSQLRKELNDIRLKFDPEGDDFASQNMVIVGHSMGGLLTKMMVHKPKTTLWDKFSKVPIEELEYPEGEEDSEELLRSMFIYEPLPYVRRVVFVATPHRGSDISTNFIGRLGSALTSIPRFLAKTTSSVLTANMDKLKIEPNRIISLEPTAIDQLAPTSPFLLGVAEIPIPDAVPYHSVIGIRDDELAAGSSDGVVAYDSSHLEGAVSEKLVPAAHGCLEHPYTIAEIKRLLNLHLDESSTVQ